MDVCHVFDFLPILHLIIFTLNVYEQTKTWIISFGIYIFVCNYRGKAIWNGDYFSVLFR